MVDDSETPAWYEDWFGQDYLKVYPHRDEQEAIAQVRFVEQALPLAPGSKVLDLGCGGGRHARELVRRGLQVTCLDLSVVLLRLAQKQANEETCCLNYVKADMRYLPFVQSFDAVVSFFTTFGYFESDEENGKTLRSIAQVLKPGGKFLQDYLNKEAVIANIIPLDKRTEKDIEIIQEREYDRTSERINKKITLKRDGQVREYFESVRLYALDEMLGLLAKTSLKPDQVYGDFDGRPFTEQSPRLILTGHKDRNENSKQ